MLEALSGIVSQRQAGTDGRASNDLESEVGLANPDRHLDGSLELGTLARYYLLLG